MKISEQSLEEYLREQLLTQSRDMSTDLGEDTLWYIGNVLTNFCQSRHFFVREYQCVAMPTLAILYKEAQEAGSTRERLLLLRRLGDTAMFAGALFPANYEKRGLQKDYFIGMGGSAYSYLAECAVAQRSVYQELCYQFPRVLQLIASVCARHLTFSATEIFELFRRWQLSGDRDIARQLQSVGISIGSDNGVH